MSSRVKEIWRERERERERERVTGMEAETQGETERERQRERERYNGWLKYVSDCIGLIFLSIQIM